MSGSLSAPSVGNHAGMGVGERQRQIPGSIFELELAEPQYDVLHGAETLRRNGGGGSGYDEEGGALVYRQVRLQHRQGNLERSTISIASRKAPQMSWLGGGAAIANSFRTAAHEERGRDVSGE